MGKRKANFQEKSQKQNAEGDNGPLHQEKKENNQGTVSEASGKDLATEILEVGEVMDLIPVKDKQTSLAMIKLNLVET